MNKQNLIRNINNDSGIQDAITDHVDTDTVVLAAAVDAADTAIADETSDIYATVGEAAVDAVTTAVGADATLQAAILSRIEDAIENEATTIALIDALIDAKVTAHIADCSAYTQA
jgi:hypothetical protein